MAKICDTHIAAASSVFNFAFAHNKKLINLDSVCNANTEMNNIDNYINESNRGVEDSAKFWMRVWGLKTIEEFKDFIDLDRLKIFYSTNKKYERQIKQNTIPFDWDCHFLKILQKNNKNLHKFFDSYGFDNQAPQRIINFLKTKMK